MRAEPARWPRWVYDRGEEPDYRFSFANERTFLAWIRTALALVAGGVALDALGLAAWPGLRRGLVVVLVGAGVLCAGRGGRARGPARRPRVSRPPGRQRERTLLAWERTVLATLVAALVLGRIWLARSPATALVSVVLAGTAALAALAALVGRRRTASVGSATAGVALAVVVLGATELVLLGCVPG